MHVLFVIILPINHIITYLFSVICIIDYFLLIDDHSRVKLIEIPGVHGSDYINACHMDVSWHCLSCFEFVQPLVTSN